MGAHGEQTLEQVWREMGLDDGEPADRQQRTQLDPDEQMRRGEDIYRRAQAMDDGDTASD